MRTAFPWVPALRWQENPLVPDYRWHVECEHPSPGPRDLHAAQSGWCPTPQEAWEQLLDVVYWWEGMPR